MKPLRVSGKWGTVFYLPTLCKNGRAGSNRKKHWVYLNETRVNGLEMYVG